MRPNWDLLSSIYRFAGIVILAGLVSCGSKKDSVEPTRESAQVGDLNSGGEVSAGSESHSAGEEGQPLDPADERLPELQASLERTVQVLAGEIGLRFAPDPKSGIDRAANWIEAEWRAQGYQVEQQKYSLKRCEAENLWVERVGRDPKLPALVVGAHYDTARNTPGADDNASGVAILLEVTRALAAAKPKRTVIAVAFTGEEPPLFATDNMGSLQFARKLEREERAVALMLALESLGYYSSELDSQKFPAKVLGRFFPRTGDFIGVVGRLEDSEQLKRVSDLLSQQSLVKIVPACLWQEIPGVDWSDHRSFWKIGVPAIMLTDTATFRNPNYHQPSDRPDTLDYAVMAKLTLALIPALLKLDEEL